MPSRLPHLTSGLPGTGGRIRERLEDFVVEELPLYEASGVGDHLYVTVQKSGISTHEAARRIARAFGVAPALVGYAGLKDARAVSVQRFSVPGGRESVVSGGEIAGMAVLGAKPHRNKLRLGHLAGNRFLVRIRGTVPDAEARARAVLAELERRGAPNGFGPQRFGSKGDGHLVGRAIVLGDADAAVRTMLAPGPVAEADPRLVEARGRYVEGDLEGALRAFPGAYRAEKAVLGELVRGRPPDRAIRRIPKPVLRILVSSYQSSLFNRLLADRLPDLGTLETGDLAYLHDRGAVFRVENAAAEQPRADAFEISPSGPIFGKKSALADGEPGRRERALLAAEGLDLEDFRRPVGRYDGERRPFRVPLGEPRVRPEGEDAILVGFTLPRGSFATSVLREVMKGDEPEAPEDE